MRVGVTCEGPIERAFYDSAVTATAYEVCYYCGGACNEGGGVVSVPNWSRACPFCEKCKEDGRKQPVYRKAQLQTEEAREAAAKKKEDRERKAAKALEKKQKAAARKKRGKEGGKKRGRASVEESESESEGEGEEGEGGEGGEGDEEEMEVDDEF